MSSNTYRSLTAFIRRRWGHKPSLLSVQNPDRHVTHDLDEAPLYVGIDNQNRFKATPTVDELTEHHGEINGPDDHQIPLFEPNGANRHAPYQQELPVIDRNKRGYNERRRLITPDQYIARIQEEGIPKAVSGVTELYAPRRASPDTINVGHAGIEDALRSLLHPLDNLSGDYDTSIIDNEHHQLSISEVGLGDPDTIRPYYRQQTIDHTYR